MKTRITNMDTTDIAATALDGLSLALMEAVMAGDQFATLTAAARLRRLVVREKLDRMKSNGLPGAGAIADLLDETSRLEKILGKTDVK